MAITWQKRPSFLVIYNNELNEYYYLPSIDGESIEASPLVRSYMYSSTAMPCSAMVLLPRYSKAWNNHPVTIISKIVMYVVTTKIFSCVTGALKNKQWESNPPHVMQHLLTSHCSNCAVDTTITMFTILYYIFKNK